MQGKTLEEYKCIPGVIPGSIEAMFVAVNMALEKGCIPGVIPGSIKARTYFRHLALYAGAPCLYAKVLSSWVEVGSPAPMS